MQPRRTSEMNDSVWSCACCVQLMCVSWCVRLWSKSTCRWRAVEKKWRKWKLWFAESDSQKATKGSSTYAGERVKYLIHKRQQKANPHMQVTWWDHNLSYVTQTQHARPVHPQPKYTHTPTHKTTNTNTHTCMQGCFTATPMSPTHNKNTTHTYALQLHPCTHTQ